MAHRRNSKIVTRGTYVRDLPFTVMRELSRLLDPSGNLDWRAMAEQMPEYSAAEIGLFQMAYMRPGGSPTMEVLHDWGSRNRTVGNLVDLFKKMNHPVAANIILPGSMPTVVNTLPGERRPADADMPSRERSTTRPHRSEHLHNVGRQGAGFHPNNSATSHHSANTMPGHRYDPATRGHRDHITTSSDHHWYPGVGPIPSTPPTCIPTVPFSHDQSHLYEPARTSVACAPLEPIIATAEVQQSESLQPFYNTGCRPPIPMGVRVIKDKTRNPVQPQFTGSSQAAPFGRVPTTGGIVCTENVEDRRRLLAKAAEKRMTSAMGSMTLVDGGMIPRESVTSDASSIGPSEISYETLQLETSNFNEQPFYNGGRKLGGGSFGSVYFGELLIKGQQWKVAVKRLLKQSNDKDSEAQLKTQFMNELCLLAKNCHENLVLLLGYAVDGPEFCLIYEYMCNGSLMDSLSCLNGRAPLRSSTRLSIAVGCARALAFLHNRDTPLVHRDVKSSNVLLDEHLTAKLSDFGIARALEPVGDATQGGTQRTTKVQGTFPYLAPEASRGTITVKMDAFALAIVFFELLTGLTPFDETRESQDLKSHIEDQLEVHDGDKLRLLDPKADWQREIAMSLWEVSDSLSVERKNRRKSVCDVLPRIELLVGV